MEFYYSIPMKGEEYTCGYAGYSVLRYTAMPKSFKENLKLAYRDIRVNHLKKLEENYFRETTETNPPDLFFYNTSFDIQKHRLCLRYNEDWPKQTHSLELFVKTAEAVMVEWREAKKVKPFVVEYRPYKAEERDMFSGEGVVHARKGMCAILLPTSNFRDYYEYKRGTEMYVVTEKSVIRYVATGTEWKLQRRITAESSKK